MPLIRALTPQSQQDPKSGPSMPVEESSTGADTSADPAETPAPTSPPTGLPDGH